MPGTHHLYLIRHGVAEERGDAWPDDAKRPLSEHGMSRLRLAAQNIDIDKNYGLDVLKIPGTNGSDPLQGGYPRFTFNTFSSIGNPNVSNPFLFRDNQYVTNGNVSWLKGAHSFRFGFEYSKYDINHFQPQLKYGARGGFSFTGGLTSRNGGSASNSFNGWADFMLGLPAVFSQGGSQIVAEKMNYVGVYAQDVWRVSSRLTGVRGHRFRRRDASVVPPRRRRRTPWPTSSAPNSASASNTPPTGLCPSTRFTTRSFRCERLT